MDLVPLHFTYFVLFLGPLSIDCFIWSCIFGDSFADILLQVCQSRISKMLTRSNQLSTRIKVALMCHQNSVNGKFPVNL